MILIDGKRVAAKVWNFCICHWSTPWTAGLILHVDNDEELDAIRDSLVMEPRRQPLSIAPWVLVLTTKLRDFDPASPEHRANAILMGERVRHRGLVVTEIEFERPTVGQPYWVVNVEGDLLTTPNDRDGAVSEVDYS